jgi:hypothetical protein
MSLMMAGAEACNPGMTMRVPRFSHETCKKSSTAAISRPVPHYEKTSVPVVIEGNSQKSGSDPGYWK